MKERNEYQEKKKKQHKKEILPLRCPNIKKLLRWSCRFCTHLSKRVGRTIIYLVCGKIPQHFSFLLTCTDKYKSRTNPSAAGSACTSNILHQQRMFSILLRKCTPL